MNKWMNKRADEQTEWRHHHIRHSVCSSARLFICLFVCLWYLWYEQTKKKTNEQTSKWRDTHDGDVIPSVHLLVYSFVCLFVCGICGMNKQKKNEWTNEQMNRHTWWWCLSVCSSARLFICLRYLRYEQTKKRMNKRANEQTHVMVMSFHLFICSFIHSFVCLRYLRYEQTKKTN